jgi:hypothetical protein
MSTITLTHYEHGPMQVAVWDEATWWLRKRQWTCPDDPELGSFEDEDFDETSKQIDLLLARKADGLRDEIMRLERKAETGEQFGHICLLSCRLQEIEETRP